MRRANCGKSLNLFAGIILPGALFFVSTLSAFADDSRSGGSISVPNGNSSRNCLVGIRVIRGSEPESAVGEKQLDTGAFLQDVKAQLQPLPFSKYQVLESSEKTVPLMEEAVFQVTGSEGDKSVLRVTPRSIVHHRVRVFVNWRENDGEDLLSTTLRMINGRSMVLGTDSSSNRSTIMCVHIDCK